VFVFSGRRRHTRFSRDWSSDVCASDLAASYASTSGGAPTSEAPRGPMSQMLRTLLSGHVPADPTEARHLAQMREAVENLAAPLRSEERRVGKAGISHMSP